MQLNKINVPKHPIRGKYKPSHTFKARQMFDRQVGSVALKEYLEAHGFKVTQTGVVDFLVEVQSFNKRGFSVIEKVTISSRGEADRLIRLIAGQ